MTFEWVAPSNQTLIAPELRSLIQTNHSFEYSLLKNVIQTYFNHAEAIVVAKDGNNVCGYCSINKLLFSENAIELQSAFIDPAYKGIGISEKLTDMIHDRYSEFHEMQLMPMGFKNHAWTYY